jgi:hypothetical protein
LYQIITLDIKKESMVECFSSVKCWGVAKSVRHGTLTPAFVGSSPAAPAIVFYEPLAQLAEHLTFNQGVPRSSRGWLTILETRSWKLEARIGITLLFYNLASSFKPQASKCGSGGIGRRTRLRIWRVKPWGFKSLLPHQTCGSGSVVEHRLAKARVASSNLVFRSISNLIDLD